MDPAAGRRMTAGASGLPVGRNMDRGQIVGMGATAGETVPGLFTAGAAGRTLHRIGRPPSYREAGTASRPGCRMDVPSPMVRKSFFGGVSPVCPPPYFAPRMPREPPGLPPCPGHGPGRIGATGKRERGK